MRLELFFKTIIELHGLVNFLQQNPSICAVNLINKKENEPLLKYSKILKEEVPNINICTHYSLEFNQKENPEETFKNFLDFSKNASKIGVDGILLVSGDGERKYLDTISCLERISKLHPSLRPSVPLSVVYNPYLCTNMQLIENKRLERKLGTGVVSNVCLQIGCDLARLEERLTYLQKLNREKIGPKFSLSGSLLIPTASILQRLQKSPWNGVFMDEFYFKSVANAKLRTMQIANLYTKFDVEPLIEIPFRNGIIDNLPEILKYAERPK